MFTLKDGVAIFDKEPLLLDVQFENTATRKPESTQCSFSNHISATEIAKEVNGRIAAIAAQANCEETNVGIAFVDFHHPDRTESIEESAFCDLIKDMLQSNYPAERG